MVQTYNLTLKIIQKKRQIEPRSSTRKYPAGRTGSQSGRGSGSVKLISLVWKATVYLRSCIHGARAAATHRWRCCFFLHPSEDRNSFFLPNLKHPHPRKSCKRNEGHPLGPRVKLGRGWLPLTQPSRALGSELLLSLLCSVLGRGGGSSASALSGCTCPCPLLHRGNPPRLPPPSPASSGAWRGSVRSAPWCLSRGGRAGLGTVFVGNQSTVLPRGCAQGLGRMWTNQPKSSAASGAFAVWSVRATSPIPHEPTAQTWALTGNS